jgi:8-oxo-dGTP diphosphatase
MLEFFTNQADKNKQYTTRVGAYAVIKNDQGLIAAVKTSTGYFLPGGGLEPGESLAECLSRECLEEIGAEITALNNFARGTYYFHSTQADYDMLSDGYFFTCQIARFLKVETEADHELVWLEREQAIKLLYLENQRAAVGYVNA